MGRGKRATPSSDKGDTESTDSSDIKSSLKLWNCSPNQLPAHLVWLADWLPDQDPRYITLVEKGFVIDKSVSCCYSTNHIDSIVKGTLDPGSF